MDVNKNSESVITITLSLQVELRTLLEEGAEEFAKKCHDALTEELSPILGIRIVPPPVTEPHAPTEERVPVAEAPRAEPMRDDSNLTAGSSLEAQLPPSQRRRADNTDAT